jgi:hypothetical protein
MAGVALLFRYQWRAYWRRTARAGGQAPFYLFVLTPLAWVIFIKLPPLLQQAARELAAGYTASSEFVLLMFACGWLFPLFEDANLSLTAKNLLRFPLSLGSLLTLRILSLFISPLALLIVIGSLMSLFPFFKARQPLLGLVAALLFFVLAALLGLCLSHLLSVTAWRKGLLAATAIIIVPFGASLFASGNQAKPRLLSLLPYTPAHLATSAATGATIQSALVPLLLLLAAIAAAFWLLGWSFRQSLTAQPTNHSGWGSKLDFIRLPGKLGGLLGKEQRYFRKTIMPWLGFLFALVCSLALLKNAIPPLIFQTAILLLFASVLDLTMNSFGLDRAAELHRYLLFPLRGSEIMLAKNLGITVIVTAQMLPLLLLAVWRFGWLVAGVGLIEALALLLAHLAWGNFRSVNSPGKLRFYGLSSGAGSNPLYALAGAVFGSLPGWRSSI